jgi:hypothetical protein
MVKKITLILILLVIISCKESETTRKNAIRVTNKKSAPKLEEMSKKNWYNNLIVFYIKNSKNELVKMSYQNNEPIKWLLDSTEKTDSTNYYIFNIGRDVSEEDGSEKRFSPYCWLYIDSLTNKIYEYDIPNERLILWKNKNYENYRILKN